MFDYIISYSIKNKMVVGLFVVALIAVGLYSLQKLPIDALPDITNNQVQIMTSTPKLATQEVELFITYPIERAVKSIPDIVELRSVSRFGLSIVTVVFKEDVDIYWARNQITERLKAAEEEIPEGYGSPELAPISTGLGEIYQYTVKAETGFEEEHNIMDLRSIQDWIIVPQLLGTKGVAEVNTLGGILKEYEVAVNPDKLKSMDVTMAEIFEALNHNNENTGGAYIDKMPNVYFIRSVGMINSLEDVRKIVVKMNGDVPILIRDVAKVDFGSTVRYGAATKDGEGEVVNGMVMMLKGENSAEIVSLVKERMEQIKTTLPEGVVVTPYLDRSKLVNRAIATVTKNLIEGALIVIFILILLIGNWRAGLIVATVIPLSLLFAVTLMKAFGVSGNLMSLGAIDFGLIVDGAVIIVEAIVHRLQVNPMVKRLNADEMDDEVYAATSKIRNSAAFGEIIILIVYLPILALVGIEGKMFKPMAQTVSFAILGAFILSLTYVPMMSALFLKKQTGHKKTFSDKIINFFQMIYSPILEMAMKLKPLVLLLAVGMFTWAFYIFSNLGGEFIPTLSEGDIATHIMIPPGSSLSQEIKTTTKAEKLLLDNFPEIEQVVSKIGSAEVPTDPMPMEIADVMVIMKDKKEWTSASTKEEMFEKMDAVLNDLPGVTTEFTQPIQMRFNELMTGIRSDVGVKIFGEDIEILVALGDEAEAIIKSVDGVVDCRAEAVAGLPQIVVKYDKGKLALYGLHVGDLNDAVSMGFAGKAAGVVYEGEQKYDLVVRLDEPFRQDISHLRSLYITLPSGSQIPLEQVADINYERGPAQISREDGKRRIIVGFNVRGRDVESVVAEIEAKFEQQLKLPVGYYINYAGQFENLRRANQRLSLAVPIALALIFVLLYMTFNSVKQSLLIFTAIPLSAIGGVFALWINDLPFSISAGVGFIALFGVAVLNGIVLISYFNQLKKEGMTDIIEVIRTGTSVRLRPVIMTAAVASLGFLPMALSTSAGAEVQKPLATVVIGGLITATLLTLVILPILYYYSEKGFSAFKNNKKVLGVIIFCCFIFNINAQNNNKITLDIAIEEATKNNVSISPLNLEIVKYKQIENGGYLIPKIDIGTNFGQMNTRFFDAGFSISQGFNPFLKKAKKALVTEQIDHAKFELNAKKGEIVYQVKNIWQEINFHYQSVQILKEQESIWKQFSQYANTKYRVGESDLVEKTLAEIRFEEIGQKIKMEEAKLLKTNIRLQALMNEKNPINIEYDNWDKLAWKDLDTALVSYHPIVQSALKKMEVNNAEIAVLKAEQKPEFNVGYFIQSIRGEGNESPVIDVLPRFQGVNLGVSIPLFGKKAYQNKINMAKTEAIITYAKADEIRVQLEYEIMTMLQEIDNQKQAMNYYENNALPKAKLIADTAKKSYESGDISYLEYAEALNTQYSFKMSCWQSVLIHNQAVVALEYLLDN
ncbi:MAG: cobalt-zinc-cadmium resistance protein CzcA [Maribacter sp.]|jgi:cobalt-zinc-cadmium resistance protein CzcA